ncbi:Vesicle-mediated ER to Golgi transport protein [Entomophthora muscae]|uniref:Vesicle-mediated ER to Golgi transport protein n=1 Tax=Entomophthora muscae TaxID=34485 RepID=A0ACC2T2V0_9FUNG|nr:Vesicle-mediated ER to Golgi transport protein [Entomophthora muscae]
MAMNFLYNTFVAPEPSASQEERDNIIRLKDRLETSLQPSDRRATVLALKSIAAEHRELVGEICLESLIRSLARDGADISCINACLEIFLILFSVEDKENKEDAGIRFSNQFSKKAESVSSLLDCLGEHDFYIRYNGINVLQVLHSSASGPIQASLLASPMSISRLVELLDDDRDIIRNDGLLLVTAVTETNSELQKIVAFQSVFEKLLDIIQGESGLEGGIVVEDCFTLMTNLLQNNPSNQSYFRETSCIQRLVEPLAVAGDQTDAMEWENPQKVANVIKVLHLLCLLVQPRGTHTKANQSVMGKCGIVLALVQLLGVPVLPTTVQTQAFFALGNAVLDSRPNQDIFGTATLETTLEPFIVYVVSVALDEAKEALTRFGACYTFQCYVSSNPDAQLGLASTLRRPPGLLDADGRTVGSLMIRTLFEDSSDRLGRCLASVLLSRLLWDNMACKQLLLHIQIGANDEALGFIAAILQRIVGLVENGEDHWLLGGHLALLAFWIKDCPDSAGELLRNGAGFQFVIQLAHPDSGSSPLVQGISAFLLALLYQANQNTGTHMTSATLRTIVLKRIGTEHLLGSIARLKDAVEFRLAQPWAQLSTDSSTDIVDYQFVDFF